MNKIRLLDNSTINKIAAGEVVERPSSVVKELVENSIDAGAEKITVEIKDGGISFLRVVDDGCGIPADDVKTAFLRHATSKIRRAEDLEEIFSLGFRGEALASIAAVAKVEMVTKTREEEAGTKIIINGGILEEMRSEGAAGGTSITVGDIFYNVPARKKFLRKSSTEAGQITDTIMKFVLGHPEISFRYINNGTTIIHTSGNNDIKTAVYHVYGKDTASKMLSVSAEIGEIRLSGLIGRPEMGRANRSCENLFINGRFIRNPIVSAAVEEAYKTRLMIGKFPIYVFYMEVQPSMVDVNVHPAKLEVRFRDEEVVYKLVRDCVAEAFRDKVLIKNSDWESKPSKMVKEYINPPETIPDVVQQELTTVKPEKSEEKKECAGFDKTVSEKDREAARMILSMRYGSVVKDSGKQYIIDDKKELEAGALQDTRKEVRSDEFKKRLQEIDEPKEFSPQKPFFNDYRIVGQMFSTYWIIEQGSSMFVIDQHAAHERILFERFMDRFKNGNAIVQDLVFSERLVLSGGEKATLIENISVLEKFGFKIRESGTDYYLESVPYLFDKPATSSFLVDLLDTIRSENIGNIYDTKLLSIATMACKAAVKGGDTLTAVEAEAMIKELLSLKNPFNCPHGRPTIIEMTQYELEKKFKRIQ
ncbi:DNA mismatch repair protein MutL [Clostridiales bacterium]|nr:DNA mismatch repair protein MutL [Clostridiales bacterium]